MDLDFTTAGIGLEDLRNKLSNYDTTKAVMVYISEFLIRSRDLYDLYLFLQNGTTTEIS